MCMKLRDCENVNSTSPPCYLRLQGKAWQQCRISVREVYDGNKGTMGPISSRQVYHFVSRVKDQMHPITAVRYPLERNVVRISEDIELKDVTYCWDSSILGKKRLQSNGLICLIINMWIQFCKTFCRIAPSTDDDDYSIKFHTILVNI